MLGGAVARKHRAQALTRLVMARRSTAAEVDLAAVPRQKLCIVNAQSARVATSSGRRTGMGQAMSRSIRWQTEDLESETVTTIVRPPFDAAPPIPILLYRATLCAAFTCRHRVGRRSAHHRLLDECGGAIH